MNKAILLIALMAGWNCISQNHAFCTPSQPKGGNGTSGTGQTAPPALDHMQDVPNSTKAILQSVIPKIHLRESSLPEAARFFERESLKLDPAHTGLKIMILTPKDLGYWNGSSPYVIWYSETNIPFGQALINVAHRFKMKLEIRKDIYIMPTFANFADWEKNQR
jgi:hypothetical protein